MPFLHYGPSKGTVPKDLRRLHPSTTSKKETLNSQLGAVRGALPLATQTNNSFLVGSKLYIASR